MPHSEPILSVSGVMAWVGSNPDLSAEAQKRILSIALADTQALPQDGEDEDNGDDE